MLDHALEYLQLGLNVVPLHSVRDGRCSCGKPHCGKPGKHPRIKWRPLQTAPLDEAQIRQYWTTWPDANIGVITGKASGVAVLDIDGPNGVAALEAIGLPLSELPRTPVALTGGGGLHYYYRFDPSASTAGGVLRNVDIRAEGGLAVLPPSNHASGVAYRWQEGLDPQTVDFGDLDFGIIQPSSSPLATAAAKPRWHERLLEGLGEGGRNDAAARLAGRYLGLGLSEVEVFLLLRGWNTFNDPPMELPELRRTVQSISEAEHATDNLDLIQRIGDVMRIKLSGIKRITGDDPKIILEFDVGTAVMTTAQLLSPQSFQRSVAEATKLVPRKLSARTIPTHDKLAQMILSASVDVDAGEEATGSGEMMLMINDYLEAHDILPAGASLRGPFAVKSHVWFGLPELVRHIGVRWGSKMSVQATAQMLRAMGVKRESFSLPGGSVRVCWGIETSRVPWVAIEEGTRGASNDTTATGAN